METIRNPLVKRDNTKSSMFHDQFAEEIKARAMEGAIDAIAALSPHYLSRQVYTSFRLNRNKRLSVYLSGTSYAAMPALRAVRVYVYLLRVRSPN